MSADRIRYLPVLGLEAARALTLMVGWAGGEIPVYVDGKGASEFVLPAGPGAGDELWRRAERLDREHSAQVEIGLPGHGQYVTNGTVLWAWTTGRDQRWRASQFRPEPSMVLRFGASSDRLSIWSLEEEITWQQLELHNDRLAYALHAARTRTKGERLRIPLPGTFIRVGRRVPAPVLVTRLEPVSYSLRQVTGSLKDAPSRDAWRERQELREEG